MRACGQPGQEQRLARRRAWRAAGWTDGAADLGAAALAFKALQQARLRCPSSAVERAFQRGLDRRWGAPL